MLPRVVFDSHLFCRGKADCDDIDILITYPVDDGKTHAGESCWISVMLDFQSS